MVEAPGIAQVADDRRELNLRQPARQGYLSNRAGPLSPPIRIVMGARTRRVGG
jgi:hypothetical protein